jgi:hypothetical protein|tara:strand:+ start:952 stop:1785 length:834 start_codon:yes stop_codon:yes gene_type:complete
MDLNVIKQRLNQMQKSSSAQGSGGGKNMFWKPSVGKQTVRVVPFKYNKENPFTEMKFYYGIGSKKVMASPANWGEKDPIMEFAKQLRQSNDKDNWRLAKKLDAKTRIFAPVVVRGEEGEGVKLWQFGKEIYEAFLQLAADEEVGDFTDFSQGRDIKLNTVGPESTGTPYNRTTLGPSMKTSPLSESSDEIEKFLEDQVDPKKVFKPLSYDEMKSALQEWLSPEDNEEITSEPAVAFDNDVKKAPDSNYSLSAKPKQSTSDKFDSLFDDDKKTDDLPF